MKYLQNHKKIMLILTENCNLRCKYCYEQDKKRTTMEFETAKRILDDSLSKMDDYESAIIELHGGEPFLNFHLIKEIDEYVIHNYDFPILFRTTTNGTCVKGEIQKWLSERKDRYEIMLSLDGMKESHDINRITVDSKGSFDLIDIEFFAKTWPNCPVSMTISERTIEHMAENTIWIQEQGMDCLNAFQWAISWDKDNIYPILKREVKKLVKYYSTHPEKHTCLLLNYQMEKFNNEITDEFRYCVEIDDPIECYDACGRYAPCHGFTAFTMGSEEEAKKLVNYSIRDLRVEPRNMCYNCQLLQLCRICFAANHMLTGDMQNQNHEICLFNQICILGGIQIERLRHSETMTEEYKKLLDKIEKFVIDKGDVDIDCSYYNY